MADGARRGAAASAATSEAEPEPPDDGFFDHIYADPPPRLTEQRQAYNALRAR
ncbi:MAG: hypothetical protein K6T92_09390 [Candidatus Rokubacteria bacterium]|nr:hypothetical protein [Candidatus Rokubacteria bacterium]